MSNARGQVTVDFLFAMVLVLGFSGLLFVVTFTLSVASITQYITYSAARSYVVANLDRDTQIRRGKEKYLELINDPVFKPLYSNGWFKIDAEAFVGDHTTIIPEYQAATEGVNAFWGVGTNFVARVLDFRIPFFGSTAPDSDGSGAGFKTYIGSYLGREPTAEECITFTAARWQAIRNLPNSGGAASFSSGSANSEYFPMTDDGC